MPTHTDITARLRLLQLASPGLPVGAFAYSQGLEWAVERGWICDQADTEGWLRSILKGNLTHVDVPLIKRMFAAFRDADDAALSHWCSYAHAARETRELRDEDRHRATAFVRLLDDFPIPSFDTYREVMQMSPLAPYAYAALHLGIPLHDAVAGHLWSWLENSVTAAIKLVPLGQSQGQQLLMTLSGEISALLTLGFNLGDEQIGYSAPAMALASSRHESQYTRLFRS